MAPEKCQINSNRVTSMEGVVCIEKAFAGVSLYFWSEYGLRQNFVY